MTGISKELHSYFKICGHSAQQIESYGMGTRIFHDLGIYGEIAEDHMVTLANDFGVDLSAFVFEDYFPNEFAGQTTLQTWLFWVFPWLTINRIKKAKTHGGISH
jgi:hypothetical protein